MASLKATEAEKAEKVFTALSEKSAQRALEIFRTIRNLKNNLQQIKNAAVIKCETNGEGIGYGPRLELKKKDKAFLVVKTTLCDKIKSEISDLKLELNDMGFAYEDSAKG